MDGIEIRSVGIPSTRPTSIFFLPAAWRKPSVSLPRPGWKFRSDLRRLPGLPSVADRELAEAVAYVDLAARLGAPYVA